MVAVTLGSVTFDAAHTTVREKLEEVGGRDCRAIEIVGFVVGAPTVGDIEAALDAILAAASDEAHETELSVRAGRVMWVRRVGFKREVSRETLVGSFQLTLEAEDPFEMSDTEHLSEWEVLESGATHVVAAVGNVFSEPVITLVADGGVVNPSFTDGARQIAYAGTVADGESLVFDGPAGKVTLEGADVTPYTSGVFPRLAPGNTTLTYHDDDSSSHSASVSVAFRDRWW